MTEPLRQQTSREAFAISIHVDARQIGIVGEVDMVTGPSVVVAATSFFGDPAGDLILDLSGVTFADSALLNAIEEISGRLDGELWVINPTAAVKRLFLAGRATHLLRESPVPPG